MKQKMKLLSLFRLFASWFRLILGAVSIVLFLTLQGCDSKSGEDQSSHDANKLSESHTSEPKKTISGIWENRQTALNVTLLTTWEFQSNGVVAKSFYMGSPDKTLEDKYATGTYTISDGTITAIFSSDPQHTQLSVEPNGDLVIESFKEAGEPGLRLTPKKN
jgi:hypothetical protein